MTCRFCEAPTVTLLVGKSKKPFYVHLDLLCDVSRCFKAELAGSLEKSFKQSMQLPQTVESTFELFLDWLYYQRYEMLPEADCDDDENGNGVDEGDDDDDDDDDERFLQAFRLFVFADKYKIFKLKNLVIEKLFADGVTCTKGPPFASITYAYKHTTQGSSLRKLLADWNCWNLDLKYYEDPAIQTCLREQPDLTTDLFVNLAKHLEGRKQTYNPFEGEMPEGYKDEESNQKK